MIPPTVTVALGEIVVAILALLAAVHLFWALGGRLGKGLAVPEKANKAGPAMRPKPAATLLVATALAVAADLVAMRAGLLSSLLPAWLPQTFCALLALVLLARAIGDRRYVGFFKRIKDTRFARLDTMAYSPLCLVLAVMVGVTAW